MLTFPADRRGSRRLENAGSRTFLAALLLTLAFPAAAQNPVEVTALEATGTDEHVMLWDTDANVFSQRRMIAIVPFLTTSRPAWQNGGAQVHAGPTFINCAANITCAAVSGGGVSIEGTATPGTSDGRLSALDFDASSRELTATLTQGHSDVTVTIPGGGSGAIETITEGSNGGLALVGCLQADTTCALSVANGEVTPEMLEASNTPSGSTRFYREDGIWTLPAGSAFTWGAGLENNGSTVFFDGDGLPRLASNEGVQTTDLFPMVNESNASDRSEAALWTQLVDALASPAGNGLSRSGRGLAQRWSGYAALPGNLQGTDRIGVGRGTGGSEGVYGTAVSSLFGAMAAGDLELNGLDLDIGDGTVDGDALAADAVGPDQMDAAGASAGDIMIIGSGGPEWGLPFEFPRTRSGRSASTADGDPFTVVTSTIQAAHGESISAAATFTVRKTESGSTRACSAYFGVLGGINIAGITVLSGSQDGPLEVSISAQTTLGDRGNSVAISLNIDRTSGSGPAHCQIDSGATLTLTTP